MTSVHPHGRGDNLWWSGRYHGPGGSPPRAWGQYARYRSSADAARFTPTGVGTMLGCLPWPLVLPVHPHGRGDNSGSNTDDVERLGSPPRAWGQFNLSETQPHATRFTPTGVGTIRCGRAVASGSTVHPHGRGDNGDSIRIRIAVSGSPPRAWGQYTQPRPHRRP